MPRFHFDIVNGRSVHRDETGEVCLNHEAAELEAILTAAEMAKHELGKTRSFERSVEVRDESDVPVIRVCVSVALDVHRLK